MIRGREKVSGIHLGKCMWNDTDTPVKSTAQVFKWRASKASAKSSKHRCRNMAHPEINNVIDRSRLAAIR
jgi:hypothetical protein